VGETPTLKSGDLMERVNLLGALSAQAIFLVCISVFCARLLGKAKVEYWLGVSLLLVAIPLVYLVITAPRFNRPPLYYIQIYLMLAYLLVELLLDYVLKIEFRQVRWMVISYITIFFAGTGGMIGVAGSAGGHWTVVSVILFLIMAVLAFFQRAKTGM
ncbi:MAG: hypothetical protein KOO60_14625, partial [Gemmatimonadales bacterium]|nr:hypothetical protein [Gemmatimonadales bacterium]